MTTKSKTTATAAPAKTAAPRETRIGKVTTLLKRKQGATLDQMVKVAEVARSKDINSSFV